MLRRNRVRTNYNMTVERPVQTSTDAENEPVFDPDNRTEILTNESVRFSAGGTSFVREEGGERVRRMPTAKGRGGLVSTLSEGDHVTLTPMDTGVDDTDSAEFEIVAVNGQYGRRARPVSTTIELESK